jgi:hypothetical protein
MNRWIMIRKSASPLHISYGKEFTNNLSGYNIQYREQPEFEIQIDLSPNLHKRNKQINTYQDAQELADGAILNLELIQLDDRRVRQAIIQSGPRVRNLSNKWKLTLCLGKEWSFTVTAQVVGSDSLILRVCA